MMRKIFGGAMAFSMVGAVVLGGVLAWSNSQSFTEDAQVGRLSFDLQWVHNNDRIGPNDDIYRLTDNITITNTGGSTGFDLLFDSGHVDILDVSNPVFGTSDQANCGTQNFVGAILDQTGGAALLSTSANPADMQGNAAAQMKVISGAPNACQSDVVDYRVVINMKTKPGN
jgi:hypothetical protein